jgi:hypothetical protein
MFSTTARILVRSRREDTMQVIDATYERTGIDSQQHEVGTVTVTFRNHRQSEFYDVDARDFQRWAVSRYDPTEVPYDMQVAFNVENYCMDRLAEAHE